MNWSELKLSTNELAHNSHRLIPKDSHINNVIHCYFLFKVSECPVRHKANSLDLPYCMKNPNFATQISGRIARMSFARIIQSERVLMCNSICIEVLILEKLLVVLIVFVS